MDSALTFCILREGAENIKNIFSELLLYQQEQHKSRTFCGEQMSVHCKFQCNRNYSLARRDSPCGCPTQAPSDEGAVERSETEGEIPKICYLLLSLPQSFFCEKRQLPRQREPVFIRFLRKRRSCVASERQPKAVANDTEQTTTPCEAPTPLHSSLFTLTSPARRCLLPDKATHNP